MTAEADLKLARGIAAGDEAAAEELMRSLGGPMFGFARKMLGDEGDAEDVLQEAMLGILKSAESYDGRVSLRGWAFGILRHKIADRLRKRGREPVFTADDPESAGYHSSGAWKNDVTFDPWNENIEVLEVVRECMEKLPQSQREALYLRTIKDLPSEEVAEILEVTPVNLRKILHRGRQGVRRCADAKLGGSVLGDKSGFDSRGGSS